jgi:hypothetical protein
VTAPLRVPELAPSLGRVLVPRPRTAPWVALDDIREDLATCVIGLAGAARAGTDRSATVAALGRPAWLAAWERAVQRTAERTAAALDQELSTAASRVRMPRRKAHRYLLTRGERRAIAARLGSSAERLVAALDALDAVGTRAAVASDPALDTEWQDAVRTAARRLEAAWLALEATLAEEEERWAAERAAIEAWRPALWPVLALWVPVAGVLLWLGLVIGGYIPAPAGLANLLGSRVDEHAGVGR